MTQQKEWTFKEKINVCFFLALILQRSVVVTCRNKWGSQALGLPCLLALVLMVLWYVATGDSFMLLWAVFWLVCLVKRRIEAVRMSNEIPSDSDGHTINLGSNEKLAKLIYEPVLVGILGFMAFKFYQFQGWRPIGLPYFLLSGSVSLALVAAVQYTIWQRRVQGVIDAKLQNEAMMEEFHNRFRR